MASHIACGVGTRLGLASCRRRAGTRVMGMDLACLHILYFAPVKAAK